MATGKKRAGTARASRAAKKPRKKATQARKAAPAKKSPARKAPAKKTATRQSGGRGRQGRVLRLPKALLINIDNTLYLIEQRDKLWSDLAGLLTTDALRPHRIDKKAKSKVALTHEEIRKVLSPDFAIRPLKR